MYRIIHGETRDLPDAAAFIETLNTLDQSPSPEARQLFDPKAELTVARAPGRLDVMGGIADYSGSLVLELPIREATFVAVQRDSRAVVRLVTLLEDVTLDTSCEISLKDLKRDQPDAYSVIRARLRTNPRRHWAGYAAGAFSVLMREIGCTFDEGARIVIHSNVL